VQDNRTTGRKSDRRKSMDGVRGRKSAPQRQRSPRRSSPVSFVAMAMVTWSCSGASSRCFSTASSRCYNTTSLRRCNITSLQRSNAVARIATALRRCCSMCRDDTAALLQHASWQRCCNTRRGNAAVTRVAATVGRAMLLCSNGRWPAPKFLLFFFYSKVSKREREQDREKRDMASKPVSQLCWLA